MCSEVRGTQTHVKDTANGVCQAQRASNHATIREKDGLTLSCHLRQYAVAEALVAEKVAGMSARACGAIDDGSVVHANAALQLRCCSTCTLEFLKLMVHAHFVKRVAGSGKLCE
jgi:hypothetical protein